MAVLMLPAMLLVACVGTIESPATRDGGARYDGQPPPRDGGFTDGHDGAPITDACLQGDARVTDARGAAASRLEEDHRGREWYLSDWAACSRPYAKDLARREADYLGRWGEAWDGAEYRSHLVSPGNWTWEEFTVIENGRDYLAETEKSQVVVVAPLGGDVTGVYALTDFGFFHIDPESKESTFIGQQGAGGAVDGLDDVARMAPNRDRYGHWATSDWITGRVYFDQSDDEGNKSIRYWEKLWPFEVDGEIVLLPAIALADDLYRELQSPQGAAITPLADGRARFRLGTLATGYGSLLRLRTWGSRVLLSPDGTRTYVQPVANWPPKLDRISVIETWEDQDLGEIAVPETIPVGPTTDSHPAFSMRYDPFVYVARHTGSGGGPGLAFRFDTRDGALQMLYDSTSVWDLIDPETGDPLKRPEAYRELRASTGLPNDGPADAITLSFTTTCFQTQSPRTGAVINGGWDASGLRRYHDGFVTSLVAHAQMRMNGGRPEWGDDKVAAFGSLQSAPAIAPNGDVYLASCQEELVFPDDPLRVNGIRVIRLSRTDWPAQQPVNGYANQFFSLAARRALTLQYLQRAIDAL
jgi:hypothetical protein